jgi:hypothetical protein
MWLAASLPSSLLVGGFCPYFVRTTIKIWDLPSFALSFTFVCLRLCLLAFDLLLSALACSCGPEKEKALTAGVSRLFLFG